MQKRSLNVATCLILVILTACGYSDREECLREELSGEANEYAAKLKAAKCIEDYELQSSPSSNGRVYHTFWGACVSYQLSAKEERDMVRRMRIGGLESLTTPQLDRLISAGEWCSSK